MCALMEHVVITASERGTVVLPAEAAPAAVQGVARRQQFAQR